MDHGGSSVESLEAIDVSSLEETDSTVDASSQMEEGQPDRLLYLIHALLHVMATRANALKRQEKSIAAAIKPRKLDHVRNSLHTKY